MTDKGEVDEIRDEGVDRGVSRMFGSGSIDQHKTGEIAKYMSTIYMILRAVCRLCSTVIPKCLCGRSIIQHQ